MGWFQVTQFIGCPLPPALRAVAAEVCPRPHIRGSGSRRLSVTKGHLSWTRARRSAERWSLGVDDRAVRRYLERGRLRVRRERRKHELVTA